MAKKAFEKREAQLHKFDALSELNVGYGIGKVSYPMFLYCWNI